MTLPGVGAAVGARLKATDGPELQKHSQEEIMKKANQKPVSKKKQKPQPARVNFSVMYSGKIL